MSPKSCKKEIPLGFIQYFQKCLNSTFCSHFILLGKGLEDALEPAEAGYSGAFLMAGVTRLELAASGVTGRRSNQLSYTPNSNGV
jgi:hypothetical protein